MKIGLICAEVSELAPFLEKIENQKSTRKAMLDFFEGTLGGLDVVAVRCGVAKVNAAIATQLMIDLFSVDIVINPGTAGGMDPKLDLFETVISTKLAYHDVAPDILIESHPKTETEYFHGDEKLIALACAAAEKVGRGAQTHCGCMVTGEKFIADKGRQPILDAYSPLCVDMEAGSIAHVCYVNEIPFLSIRSITDTATHSGRGTFQENCEKACEVTTRITMAMLDEMTKIL